MNEICYTLLTDGSSDKALSFIIDWLINDLFPQIPFKKEFADLSRIPNPPKSLKERILKTIELFPCDILFIHRDAEKHDPATFRLRCKEIENSYKSAFPIGTSVKMVKIIPVRMMETWLLIDEKAIKLASGNRVSKESIQLPSISKIEQLPKTKELLISKIKIASGLKGRRLDRINLRHAVHLVAENIDDYSKLRQLSSFKFFEKELQIVLKEYS
jgi:hypothetical protein